MIIKTVLCSGFIALFLVQDAMFKDIVWNYYAPLPAVRVIIQTLSAHAYDVFLAPISRTQRGFSTAIAYSVATVAPFSSDKPIIAG